MKYTLIALVGVLALSACSSTGQFISPAAMTPQERCDNALLALVLVEANMPEGSEVVERAQMNYNLICAGLTP